jgi:hypothetical protein
MKYGMSWTSGFWNTVGMHVYTVTFLGCAWLIRRVLERMIGFIDTLLTQLETTGNYSAIGDLHTLQFTVAYTLGFSVFTSRILATDL